MAFGSLPPMANVPALKAIREAAPGSGSMPPLAHHVPLLNGVQFAMRTHAERGASFNTSTNRFLESGHDQTYVVGGEPDTRGQRIPTHQVPHVDVQTAMGHIQRVRQESGNRPDAIAGSWVVPDRVDLDASSGFANRRQALKVATHRNEEAIWDNAAGEEILTKHGRKARAKS